MNVVKANSQVFQALYIDTDAKNNKDRIVLIEETCEGLPAAQGILNTMLKEPYYGVVVAGTNIAVMKFRSKLIDADIETGLGSKEISEILTEIANLAYDNKCEIPYYKGPVQYGDLPKMTVALDLKSLLSGFKGFTGKDFMDNLIGVNKDLKKEVEKIDLKKYKEMKKWIKSNEKNVIELEKLLKDGDKKTIDLDNFLKNALVDDVEKYLGKNYDNNKYYVVDTKNFKKEALKDETNKDYSLEQIKKYKEDPYSLDESGDFPTKISDPREALKKVLLSEEVDGRKMDPKNLMEIGITDDGSKLLVVLLKPMNFNLPYWPKSPEINPPISILEDYSFMGQDK